VPHVTCGIGQQTERAQTLNDRTLQFIIGEVVELAGRANLAAPDPLPASDPHFFDRGDRSAELIANSAILLAVRCASSFLRS
jgi:hypothetical protein